MLQVIYRLLECEWYMTQQFEISETSGEPPGEAPEVGGKSRTKLFILGVFIVVPFLALIAAVPVAWGWGLGWRDVVLAVIFYVVSCLGVTVGYHRHFTHGAFKARRPVRIALAIAGSLAIEGPVAQWVADHRKHHLFSDKLGDPHSPWLYGDSVSALLKGLFHAHVGWFFDSEDASPRKYARDLVKDRAIMRVSRAFPALVVVSLLLPALIGGLWWMSWQGAVTAFFWAGLVRIGLLNHVTFSINSICHVTGRRPFASTDRSGNVWWLALPSLGEAWHNYHHADSSSARHGVLRGQIDISAGVIWLLERFRLVYHVQWPDRARIESKRAVV